MRKSQLEDHARGYGAGFQNLIKVENDLNKRDLEDLKGKTSDCVIYVQVMDERVSTLEKKIETFSKSVDEKMEAAQASAFILENNSRILKV